MILHFYEGDMMISEHATQFIITINNIFVYYLAMIILDNTWIGLHQERKYDPWTWTDHSDYDFPYWSPGQPNQNESEFCAAKIESAQGMYNDYSCDQSFPYICEYFPCKFPIAKC